MLVVKPYSGGITCWADSYRVMPGSGYHPVVAMLSLFGDSVSVRAVWAKVHDGNRKVDGLLDIGGHTVMVQPGMMRIATTTGVDLLHLVMVHPAMTHQWSPFSSWFMVAGEESEAKTLFFNRLNRMCPIPFRPEWQETLWRIGREGHTIEALGGYGLPVYRINASSDVWGPIVKKAIQDGSLS